MGSSSMNSPYQWTPDAVLRDCSLGICSFYCPRWCSVIDPPPPPSFAAIGVIAAGDTNNDADDGDSNAFQLSPLIVALIGILASAFVLITYYTIISRFCTRRARIHQNDINQSVNDSSQSAIQFSSSSANTGLDDAVIRSITVCKYKKGDGLVEGTDCSVCLSEFQDSESLRLLPKCNHAFHLPCIDTWLRSHSSCPLCRSNIIISNGSSSGTSQNQTENRSTQFQEASQTHRVNVSALEYQYRNDTVIVIQGSEQEIQAGHGGNLEERDASELNQGRLLVSDILRNSEDDEDDDEEAEIGSSKENGREEDKRKARLE